jgi:HEAT repeat protein
VLAALRSDDAEARRAALVALEAGTAPIDAEICAALIELLAHPNKESRRRAAGALSLAAADPAHRASLARSLSDADASRRWGAAFALARAGVRDDAVVAAATEALGASDGDVRWAAAEIVCAAARERPAVVAAIRDACGSAVPERRKMALYCLRDVAGPDAVPFLAALTDPDRGVRLAGLAGLARFDALDEDATARLIACMRDDADAGVRRAAAATVAKMAGRDASAAAALASAAGESDDRDFVRAATGRSAGRKER